MRVYDAENETNNRDAMVIQRWQSVLLLVAAVMMGLASFKTLAGIQATDFTYTFSALGFEYAGEATGGATTGWALRTWTLFIVTLTGTILPLIDIFLFKKLRLQMRLALVCVLFCITTCAIAGLSAYRFADGATVSWTQVACAPLLALVAEVMAWQRMASDKRKLSAADRLR